MADRRKPKEPRETRGGRRPRAKAMATPRARAREGSASAFRRALSTVARFLEATSRPAAILGGVAVIAHGYARFTADIDIAVVAQPEDVEELLAEARKVGLTPRIRNAAHFARENFVLLLRDAKSGVPIDMSLALQPFEREAAQRAEARVVGDVTVKVMPLAAMLIYKLIAGRPRDLDDARALIATGVGFDAQTVEATLAEFDAILETDRAIEFRRLLESSPKRARSRSGRRTR